MEKINSILETLQVNSSKFTDDEKSALLIYISDTDNIFTVKQSYLASRSVEHFFSTLAFLMERKVEKSMSKERLLDPNNFAECIVTMGWQDEFANECISCFTRAKMDNLGSGWGHRMIDEWVGIWLSDIVERIRYDNADFTSIRTEHSNVY
jgi:hypothetical protein